jgi:hypothetical protein
MEDQFQAMFQRVWKDRIREELKSGNWSYFDTLMEELADKLCARAPAKAHTQIRKSMSVGSDRYSRVSAAAGWVAYVGGTEVSCSNLATCNLTDIIPDILLDANQSLDQVDVRG